MSQREAWLYGEPALKELLDDPVTWTIMRYDRLTPEDVWAAVAQARRGLRPMGPNREEAA